MKIYLDKKGVVIDSSKITIHGTSYPLGNISAYNTKIIYNHVFDWPQALLASALIAAVISIVTWFLDIFNLEDAFGIFLLIWALIVIYMKHIDDPNKPVFSYSVLEITAAGTSKHALMVHDMNDDLAYETKIALDEAIGDFATR